MTIQQQGPAATYAPTWSPKNSLGEFYRSGGRLEQLHVPRCVEYSEAPSSELARRSGFRQPTRQIHTMNYAETTQGAQNTLPPEPNLPRRARQTWIESL